MKPLVRIEASVRFLSSEPLLTALPGLSLDGIGWLIVGGQSGRDAVPTHPDWVRNLRDLCIAAGVPFHFKQWGEWLPGENYGWAKGRWQDGQEGQRTDSREWRHFGTPGEHGAFAVRVGKKAAGAMLDGREWREIPTINHGASR